MAAGDIFSAAVLPRSDKQCPTPPGVVKSVFMELARMAREPTVELMDAAKVPARSLGADTPSFGEEGGDCNPLSDKIIRFEQLRGMLAEKFPAATQGLQAPKPVERAAIPAGILTEITGPSGGVGLLMLDALIAPSAFAAVVDASDSFDPSDVPEDFLSRLLWVRCEKLAGAIQAVDLLLRDGNLPMVLLDLRMVAAKELRAVPASTWHRFQRLLEQQGCALGICTARPCIPAARLRMHARSQWTLRDLLRPREELMAELRTESQYRGVTAPGERALHIA